MTHIKSKISLFFFLSTIILSPVLAEEGITKDVIRIGGVLDLEGRSKGLGQNMQAGIKAAFKDVIIKGRHLEYITLNDSYTPKKTIKGINELIKQKVFLFAGNVGTPTAKVALPILAKYNIPAVGFFTGAGLLRPGKGNIINYRASYIQETASVIKAALKSGIKATEVCAYVQNDAYGMAGIEGVIRALDNVNDNEKVVGTLQKIISLQGDNPPRNNIGPVGVYKRNSYFARPGYKSLKAWEKQQNTQCKLVVTVGSYKSVTELIAYSRYKKEPWIFSAVSFTGANNFRNALQEFKINDSVIMTQVVPLLDSEIPLVQEAKKKLGQNYGYVSLEGFIVGKLLIYGLKKIEGEITRKRFADSIINSRFSIGQLNFDFLENNQGSNLVNLMALKKGTWVEGTNSNLWGK